MGGDRLPEIAFLDPHRVADIIDAVGAHIAFTQTGFMSPKFNAKYA